MDIFSNPNLPTSNNEHDALQNSPSLEQRLEVCFARIESLLASLPQIIWLGDFNGSVTNFNPRWYEYTGLTASESLGWEFLQAIHPEESALWRDSFAASVDSSSEAASNQPQNYPKECRIRGSDGTYRWFIGQITPVRAANGQVLEWIGTYTPKQEPLHPVEDKVADPEKLVTSPRIQTSRTQDGENPKALHPNDKGERNSGLCLVPFAFSGNREDSALSSSDRESWYEPVAHTPVFATGNQQPAKLRPGEQAVDNIAKSTQQRPNLVNELSHAIIWEADPTSDQFTFVSKSAERLLGYPLERWLMEPDFWVNLIHPDDRQWTVALCRKKMSQCRDYELEYRCIAADQRVIWLRDRAYVVLDQQGRVHKRRGLMVDITAAKVAEAELQVRLGQQAAIAQLSQQALLGIQVSALIDECLSLLCQTLMVEYCQVWELLPDGNRLKLRAGFGWHEGLEEQVQLDATANTHIGYTMRLGQPVVVEDLRHETRFPGLPLLDDCNIISGISALVGGSAFRLKEELQSQGISQLFPQNYSHTLIPRLGYALAPYQANAPLQYLTASTTPPASLSPGLPLPIATPDDALSPLPRPFGVLAVYTSRKRVFSPSDVDFFQSVANVLAGAMQCQQADAAFHEAKVQLTQTTTALEKRSQELDEFTYITSHDLKAPLRAIANLSQWIEEDITEQLNGENLHQLQLLRSRVYRLEALIEGLLQYSRAGRLKFEPELVDVAALLKQVIRTLEPPAQFTITIAPGMPSFVTEYLPLEQVFTHLIDNAIKHHPSAKGKVTISVREQSNVYEFAVADDGAGIAPQFQEKVFAIFQTLQPKDTVENTGVGLAIAKRIVEGKGGTIRLESQEGRGATFYFTWLSVLH